MRMPFALALALPEVLPEVAPLGLGLMDFGASWLVRSSDECNVW